MPRIVVLDNLSEDGLNMMKEAGIEYEVRTGLKGEDLRQTLNEFDAAICRSGVKITPESLEGNTRLKAIARAGVGVDNIDLKAATRHGIIVMNTPGGNTNSTAEQTFALMLALSRNTAPAYQSLIEGRWDRKKFTGHQLFGKTLGIIGMGRIGQTVAKFATAFGMNIVAYDPFLAKSRAAELGITVYETVDEILPLVDYLTDSGIFPGYVQSVDWRTKGGAPSGYNYLADNYYFLLAAITGHFGVEFPELIAPNRPSGKE